MFRVPQGDLILERFLPWLKSQKKMCQITPVERYSPKVISNQGQNLSHFLWKLSQIEELSEIKPPFKENSSYK